MSDESRYRIPKTLDAPEKLGFWTVDEAGAFVVPLIIGIIGKLFITGLVAGVVACYALKKLKGVEQTNILIYALYWQLPSTLFKLRFTPPSYKRRLVG